MTEQKRLYDKLREEKADFLDGMLHSPSRAVIEAAGDIVTMTNILNFFKDNNQFSNSQAKWLHDHYSLAELCEDWREIYGRLEDVEVYTIMKYAQGKGIEDAVLDLPGAAIAGDNVHNYIVKQAVLFDDNVGFVIAHNPNAASPYVTWRIFNDGGKLEYEWGHYLSSEEFAIRDYISRCEDYTENKELNEIPVPPPTRFASVPQSDHTVIVDGTPSGKKVSSDEIDRTYKAELQLPDQEDLHLEVFGADNDVAAVKYAYELCMESDDTQLVEVHELNENYDIIREIDLRNHDPELRRFMGVDIIDFLGQIADKTIIHHKNDFKIDVDELWRIALKENPAEHRKMWHCCSFGTHILDERDVFIKDTGAYGYWTNYRPNDEDMVGYIVEITGYEPKSDKIIGNIYDVGEYYAHSLYVKENALHLSEVSITYSLDWGINAGKTITVPRYEYDNDRHRLMSESGNVVAIKYHPYEGVKTMDALLKYEHDTRLARPVGNVQVHLQKLDARLSEIRAVKEKPTKPTKPTKPQTFEEVLREAQEKADKINRQNALNKGKTPDKNQNNPEIGE